jgi:hypothetical protein
LPGLGKGALRRQRMAKQGLCLCLCHMLRNIGL